ncbi:bifunctional 6-phosphofructo-2-kinase/fructose-2,6-bisphosphate 2-phosphatase [Morchella conica CCBAS932]|uniref:Bifunctional 6-phosphofructo-2-kinase/fructose-2,6-bisphosphate 2-phosphatase n=1 Tax=Morchella conica CCBAS932 TaxID=1392247 RepID=A0A3N4LGX2_9PEZI|nr:bifunctional 6-phosphofructo-2-kinase/fructose-2,6-bisphosphate 2-phosphatase [Morchella conica CCBAS932]
MSAALNPAHSPLPIKQTQHSSIAKSVMNTPAMTRTNSGGRDIDHLAPPPTSAAIGLGLNFSDTPAATAPNSPRIRATTLDIPGLTKSKVSPDGRIANRDIGAKLVIVMVGLPARGKSYITKKVARYLNWLQHDTEIFNVGKRRRGLDQSAAFFDPANKAAAELREKVALETLDELLDYVLHRGSIGILDATNSTLERRKAIVDRVREVAGKELGVLFLESECHDQQLLEANMRLKLSGPDYKGQDPVKALEDFKKRVAIYEKNYVTLGEFEEKQGMQYIKMIDVGRKVVTHQVKGFLGAQTVYFLLNFNLAHRQIWITRHGESTDNVLGKIGGDAPLSEEGKKYAKALTSFMEHQRRLFRQRQLQKHESAHMPPRAGDITPPNPEYSKGDSMDEDGRPAEKNFCVWTSMLQRSIQTAQYFDEEEFDIKEMRMLNELSAGVAEGKTYNDIKSIWPDQYALRKADKLHYRYPGVGGESYLDVINRLRAVIVEVERMTDHVLLIGHRVVARVLLAYFLGLDRKDVAKLDVPLGRIYGLEPKPYGTQFNTYQYNPETQWFDQIPNSQLMSEEGTLVKVNN